MIAADSTSGDMPSISSNATYAAIGVSTLLIGVLVAWKKPQLMWPFIMAACAATAVIILAEVCSTQTLEALFCAASVILGAIVAFRGLSGSPSLSTAISALVATGFFISISYSVKAIFIPLAVVAVGFAVAVVLVLPRCGRFMIGAAAPIGLLDAIFCAITHRHVTLMAAYDNLASDVIGAVLSAAVVALGCGILALRLSDSSIYLVQMTCMTGSFLASLSISGVLLICIQSLSMSAGVWIRLIFGTVLVGCSWHHNAILLRTAGSAAPQPTLPTKETPMGTFASVQAV
ncbi:hypothetical protein Ae201684P_013446 [Aphanomyces euteiches]|uniref:DUF4203 domain-containing protein n=1 Tax=Aphanomyces euteiches TaxID=100861 RepID=A0A6G0WEV8_9STRA|nr:hypothetical protein Ae201684_016248 [Aphanomyces euteiches]KAH9095331.1 hypothetical protein Ae201684P_013446 [Aphanomyces euteiches]